MKNYRYLIFDFDGTINDTAPGIISTFKKVLDVFGVDYSNVDWAEHIGPPLDYSFKKLVGGTNWQRALELYRKVFTDDDAGKNSRVYDGIPETLAALKQRGFVLSVATSKYEPFAKESLEFLHLAQYFDFVYGQNEKRGYKEEILRQLISDNGWDKASCLMIGDTCYDVDGANANGIDVLAVTYGFGKKADLAASNPTYTCDSPQEILQLLTEK